MTISAANAAPSRIAKLNDFVSTLADNDRIRGEGGSNGLTGLFKRESRSGGIQSRLKAGLKDAHNLVTGRKEVRKAIDRALDEVAPFAAENREVRDAVGAIRKEVRRGGHDLRAGAIRGHLNTIATIASEALAPSLAAIPQFLAGKELASIRTTVAAIKAGTVTLDEEQLEKIGATVAAGINSAIDAITDPKVRDDTRFAFTVSQGAQLKAEIAQALRSVDLVLDPDSQLQDLVSSAFESAMQNGPNKVTKFDEIEDAKDRYLVSKVESFELGNVKFNFEKQLSGKLNPANASLYKGSDGRQVVLKFIKPGLAGKGDDVAFEELATEAIVHRGVSQAAGKNVLGFENVIRMPDGRLAVVIELAPHGDVHSIMEKMHTAGPADLDPQQAELMRRTLAGDALKSLASFQGAGYSHLDLKGPNLFIMADGTAKIADMGTARKGDRRHLKQVFENVVWNDPIADKIFKPIKDKIEALKAPFAKKAEKLADKRAAKLRAIDANRNLSGKERAAAKTKMAAKYDPSIEAANRRLNAAGAGIDQSFDLSGFAADTWSMGTVIYQLYCGDAPFGNKDQTQIVAEQKKFMAMDPAARKDYLFGARRTTLLPVPPDMQDIILGMLDPDPSQRMSAQDALKKGVFADLQLGTTAVRDGIKKLAAWKPPSPAAIPQPAVQPRPRAPSN